VTAEINVDALPPKTPAVEDIFSPPSTEPSTARPESKDTPPPGHLTSSDQTGLAGRPSRRARPQISYKEPALNVKMRRPGKELVDAVQPQHERRTSVEPTPSTANSLNIKREQEESGLALNAIPTISDRSSNKSRDEGSPLRQKFGRRDVVEIAPPRLNSAAASHAISALISATSNSKRKATGELGSVNGVTESIAKSEMTIDSNEPPSVKDETKNHLAVFDFTDTSPNDSGHARPGNNLAKITKSSRRHSSIVATSSMEEQAEMRKAADGRLPHVNLRTGGLGVVKSSSTASLARTTNTMNPVAKDRKPGTLPSSGSSIDLKTTAEGKGTGTGTGSLRAERAASRRKSMML
jgi:hypothetical protein